MEKTYYHFFCVRDSEDSISDVMDSIINQTYKPKKIIVVNDGSSDNTSQILDTFKEKFPDLINIIHTNSKTRDYSRIPKLWNMCLTKEYDFHMVGAGDLIYEKDYAEKLVKEFEKNPKLVICSGDHFPFKTKNPHGGGRFVRQSFFFKNYDRYLEIMGYETEILYRAISNNKISKICKNVKMIHSERLGHGHNFEEFGKSMKSLGYHPLYVIGRFCVEFLKNDNIGKKGSINMLLNYISYKPEENGYFIQKNIRNNQKHEMKKYLKKLIRI